MCNVLTSRNFKQITPLKSTPISENVDITLNSQHKRESVEDAPPIGVTGLNDTTLTLEPGSRKHKKKLLEGNIYINALWKTCGICINYKNLHNLYPEEENEDNFLTMKIGRAHV